MDEKKEIEITRSFQVDVQYFVDMRTRKPGFAVRFPDGMYITDAVEIDGVRYVAGKVVSFTTSHLANTIRILLMKETDCIQTLDSGKQVISCKDLAKEFNELFSDVLPGISERTICTILREDLRLSTIRVAKGFALLIVKEEIERMLEGFELDPVDFAFAPANDLLDGKLN
jgi:hypothetical protein